MSTFVSLVTLWEHNKMENVENGETIRDIAIKLLESKHKTDHNADSTSRCIFVMGSKSCVSINKLILYIIYEIVKY